MFGLFNRARPCPELTPDESRWSLADIEALLRDIAADRADHGAPRDAEEAKGQQASQTPELCS